MVFKQLHIGQAHKVSACFGILNNSTYEVGSNTSRRAVLVCPNFVEIHLEGIPIVRVFPNVAETHLPWCKIDFVGVTGILTTPCRSGT